ncbi:MAG: hypothetical protein ABS81_08740 [Pseudonocardia sp. SCN 72-86]|nr:MAG: hypothetical protein ABS81_08740 [Pseudonocardia sp. SCN 72-86]
MAVDADAISVAAYGGPVRTAGAVLHLDPAGPVVGGPAEATPHDAAVFADFTGRVGDPVPVVGADGSARQAADLLALAVHALAGPGGVAHMTVAHPSGWQEHERATLHAALRRDGLDAPVSFVPRAVAVALRPDVPADVPLLVVDVGEYATEVSVVRPDRGTGRVVLACARADGLGAALVDRAVLDVVLGGLAPSAAGPDRAALRGLAVRCREARHVLATTGSAVVDVALPGFRGPVRVDRRRVDDVALPRLDAALDVVLRALGPLPAEATPRLAVLHGDVTATIARSVSRRTGLQSPPVAPTAAVAVTAAGLAAARSGVPRRAVPTIPAPRRNNQPLVPAPRTPTSVPRAAAEPARRTTPRVAPHRPGGPRDPHRPGLPRLGQLNPQVGRLATALRVS